MTDATQQNGVEDGEQIQRAEAAWIEVREDGTPELCMDTNRGRTVVFELSGTAAGELLKPHMQALEAARDDPTLTELLNMLHDLPSVLGAQPHGRREDWQDTTIEVTFQDDHGLRTETVLKIMRRAGWKPSYVTFSRNRITFEEADNGD